MIPGVGGAELLILLVAGLLILGPGKLPEVAGQLGRAVRDFRRMTADLTGEFEKSINESGAGDLRRTVDTELKGMKEQVASVGKSVERDLNATKASVTGVKTAAKKPAAAKPSAAKTGAATGSRTNPIKPPASAKTTTAAAKTTAPPAKPAAVSAKPGAAAAGSAGKAASPPATIATKSDPLADLVALDDDATAAEAIVAPSATIPSSRPAPTRRAPAPVAASPVGDGLSPVERARQRRQAAGYQRPGG